MTDFTNDASSMSHDTKHAHDTSNEYKLYFAIILLAALPICAAIWIYSTIRHMKLPEQGLVRMAWSEAQSVTPRLFWG